MWQFYFTLIVVCLSYWYFLSKKQPKYFPPGPWLTLPFFGDMIRIGNIATATKSARLMYGDIISYWFFHMEQVMVNSFSLLKEVGRKEDFSYRPKYMKRNGNFGIIFSDGQNWAEQRKFAASTLKNLGDSQYVKAVILEEAENLCQYILDRHGQEFDDIRMDFRLPSLNVVCRLVTNEKFPQDDDKKLQEVKDYLEYSAQFKGSVAKKICSYWPFKALNKKFKWMPNYDIGLHHLVALNRKAIVRHKANYQEGQDRDFIDCYLNQMQAAGDEKSTFQGKQGMTNLTATLTEFFLAGVDTTSSTLAWSMCYMALNPEVQQKVQDELDKVTGGQRPINIDDKQNTPYTEAVMHECQRMANVVAYFYHATSPSGGSLDSGKYSIPGGTTIACNYGAVMTDPQYFPNPEKFDPERHLNDQGKFQQHPNVIPFGIGKRRCIGETVARLQLYLFFTAILSKFTVTMPNNGTDSISEKVPDRKEIGLVVVPKPWKTKFTPRQH